MDRGARGSTRQRRDGAGHRHQRQARRVGATQRRRHRRVREERHRLGDLVKADIDAAIRREAALDSKQINVAVDGADVTLSGYVHSWSERELATNSAWSSPGVRNVIDKLTLSF
jgi:osmotically-inducible protein OsmY